MPIGRSEMLVFRRDGAAENLLIVIRGQRSKLAHVEIQSSYATAICLERLWHRRLLHRLSPERPRHRHSP